MHTVCINLVVVIPKSVSMVSVASQAQGNEVGGGGAAGDPSQQQQQQQQTKSELSALSPPSLLPSLPPSLPPSLSPSALKYPCTCDIFYCIFYAFYSLSLKSRNCEGQKDRERCIIVNSI